MQWRRVQGAEARRLDADPTLAPTATTPEQPARSRHLSRPSDIRFACAGSRSCTPPPPAPFEISRLRSLPEALGTGHRRYGRTHLPKRRPEPTNSARHSPYGGDMGSQARCARFQGRSGPGRPLGHVTPHTEMFWSARSGGAGEPSGALWRSRGRPPCPMDGPDAQTTSRARYRGGEGVKFYGDSLYFRASLGELCTLCVALGED